MLKSKLSKMLSVIMLLALLAAIPFSAACHGNKPYISSKKTLESSSFSKKVEIVIKNDTKWDYDYELVLTVTHKPGWTSSGVSGSTKEHKLTGTVRAKDKVILTPAYTNPQGVSGGVGIKYGKLQTKRHAEQ